MGVGVMIVWTGRRVRAGSGKGVVTGTGVRIPEIDWGFARIAITMTVTTPAAKIRKSPFSTQKY
jgi:hypothetical protein